MDALTHFKKQLEVINQRMLTTNHIHTCHRIMSSREQPAYATVLETEVHHLQRSIDDLKIMVANHYEPATIHGKIRPTPVEVAYETLHSIRYGDNSAMSDLS